MDSETEIKSVLKLWIKSDLGVSTAVVVWVLDYLILELELSLPIELCQSWKAIVRGDYRDSDFEVQWICECFQIDFEVKLEWESAFEFACVLTSSGFLDLDSNFKLELKWDFEVNSMWYCNSTLILIWFNTLSLIFWRMISHLNLDLTSSLSSDSKLDIDRKPSKHFKMLVKWKKSQHKTLT